MPVCTLHLLSLAISLPDFLSKLSSTLQEKPLVISRCMRWIIVPEKISTTPLVTQQPLWDLLLILKGDAGLPASLLNEKSIVQAEYTLRTGIPSSIVNNFSSTNQKLLYPQKSDIPSLTGALDKPLVKSSAQHLEFTPDLRGWIDRWDPDNTKGAVSMLNLLAFKEGMHSEYLKYGKAFSETIGKRRGGVAKVVGKVVHASGSGGNATAESGAGLMRDDADAGSDRWDEVALAHYPSIRHFADMAASEDYQAVNHKHRIGSLKDTCILCTSELEIPGMRGGEKARL